MPEVQENRLKKAVDTVEPPPFLEARVRNLIRSEARTPVRVSWLRRIAPVAAFAALSVVGVGVAYELGHLRLTVRSQESYIGSVSSRVSTLMRVGLGDHIHCSVFRKYPKNPPTVAKMEQNLGPELRGLIPIVQAHVPPEYQLVLGHKCTYHGRSYIHLSLKDGSKQVSLAITRKSQGESFETEGLLPELIQSGIPMYHSGVQRFQMDAFETRDYLVYFISDLSQEQNKQIMLSMASAVKEVLAKTDL